MPTSLMIVLMTTTVMCNILDGCPWSGHSLMWWSPDDAFGWWWCSLEMMSCLDSLMEMTWWCLAMIDMLMTYLVDDGMIHSCWWDVEELMSLVMRYPIPFHSPNLALALPILAIPCKTLIHPSLQPTLPHIPFYNLALHFTLPKPCLHKTLSSLLSLNPCFSLTLPYPSP